MTFQRSIAFPDPAVSGEAFVLIAGSTMPLVHATADTVVVEGVLPEGVALPAEIKVVRTRGSETLSLRLTATALLPQPLAGRIGFAVTPADALLWPAICQSLAGSAGLHIGAVIALSDAERAGRQRGGDRSRQLTTALLAVAIVVFGAIVGAELYGRAFVAAAGTSFVSIDLRQLRSPATGRVVFLSGKATVAAGEPLIGVTQRSGRDVIVESPCDCAIVGLPAVAGAPVRLGQPVVFLAERDAAPFIIAGVDRDLLFRLGHGATVNLKYADGVVVTRNLGPIRLVDLPPPGEEEEAEPAEESAAGEPSAPGTDDLVYIAIESGRALGHDTVGSEVAVTFDLFKGTAVGRFLGGSPLAGGADANG